MCIMHVGGSAKDGVLRQPNPLSYPFILPHETWTISIFVADFSRRIVYMHDEFFPKVTYFKVALYGFEPIFLTQTEFTTLANITSMH